MLGGAAVGGVDGVVDVAAPDGLPAAGEAAAFVAGAEESGEGAGAAVVVDGEDAAGDG